MLFDDTYNTITNESSGLYKERGSKFIALAYPVTNEDEVKEILAEVKKEYYNARHHCYAYVLNPDKSAWRVNDDGEPSGTGGRPIHGQIQSFDLTNILIVVVRYFGGTKLGVSGLINAYKAAAKDALSQANIVEKTVNEVYKLEFPYEEMNDVMRIIKEENIDILDNQYDEACMITYSIRKNEADRIKFRFMKTNVNQITYLLTR